MSDRNDFLKESHSVLEEIEHQLENMLTKKKGEVEKDLEERINKEKEEAKKKIDNIEKDFSEEKEALSNYRSVFTEFESKKENLKNQLKDHLDKAIQYQSEIESLTGKTLEELKKVNEMNQELEKIQQEAEEKAATLKKELEEKYGIKAQIPETNQHEEMGFDLEDELSRLTKIKDLLAREELKSKKKEEVPETEETEETEKKEETEEMAGGEWKAEFGEFSPEREEEAEEEAPTEIEEKEEKEDQGVESAAPEVPENEESKEEKKEEKSYGGEAEETPSQQESEPPQEYFQLLENFRRSESTEDNGEVKYFQKDDKIILDGESLISTLESKIEEVKKLYIKLTQVESPREQFFIKQEIIKHQENLRKIMLRSVRMCENETCSLPRYTSDVLNVDVLKTILEKVSMENWSNQEDFSSFEKYANELKQSYQEHTSAHSEYLQSLVEELGIR